jgi:hypothetical protein
VDKAAKAMIRENIELDSREAGERIRAVVIDKRRRRRGRTVAEGAAEIRGPALRKFATKGGRPPQDDRNKEMARELLRRLRISKDDTDAACKATDASKTTIIRQIGQEWGLEETAAFDAARRGIKLLADEGSKF